MSRTKIEWATDVWNPLVGCTKVSPGCANCYAVRVARRFNPREELVIRYGNGQLDWTGTVQLHPERLDQPLRWRKPRRVFVNSMSDLFHESVPDWFLDDLFTVMSVTQRRHTYLILTKRPERIRTYFAGRSRTQLLDRFIDKYPDIPGVFDLDITADFPLPNVLLGVSVENQATADERIPLLLQTPAAIRWISAEPLLSALDLRGYLEPELCDHAHQRCQDIGCWGSKAHLAWVVTGGESGPRARPCDLEWIRSLRDQCAAASVPLFVKQDSGPRAGQQGRIPDDLWIKEWPNGL